ncbi:MAG: TIGR03757 family integrating conjugative element protein [Candidatus Thiodiazotropha sp.]
MILTGNQAKAAQFEEVSAQVVELFSTSDLPVTGKTATNSDSGQSETKLHVYELDGIQRLEAKLSQGLTIDPAQSKQIVQQRFKKLQKNDRARMQRAAMGLAKAMQYGVDRYPAIVFDGQAVVYGVTDVQTAITHYQTWRREGKR